MKNAKGRGHGLAFRFGIRASGVFIVFIAIVIFGLIYGLPFSSFRGRAKELKDHAIYALNNGSDLLSGFISSSVQLKINIMKDIASLLAQKRSPSEYKSELLSLKQFDAIRIAETSTGRILAQVDTIGNTDAIESYEWPPSSKTNYASLGKTGRWFYNCQNNTRLDEDVTVQFMMPWPPYLDTNVLSREVHFHLATVAHFDDEWHVIDKNRDSPQLPFESEKLANLGDGIHSVENRNGIRYLVKKRPIEIAPNLSTLLVAYIDETSLYDGLKEEAFVKFVYLAIIACIGIFFVALTAHRVALPLKRFSHAVQAFVEGEEDTPLQTDAPGELRNVVESFERMRDRTKRWRAEMEKTVAVRTSQLSLQKSIVQAYAQSQDVYSIFTKMPSMFEKVFRSKCVVIRYTDWRKNVHTFHTGEGGQSDPAEYLKKPCKYSMERENRIVENTTVYLALGRSESPFTVSEEKTFDEIVEEIRSLTKTHVERELQERTRILAEGALKESEGRMRAFLEESRDMIYSTNREDIIATINQSGLALLGLSDRFEAIGHRFVEFMISADDRKFFMEKIHKQGYIDDHQIILKKKDGTPIFCIETAHLFTSKDGKTIETQGIVKDITDRINEEKILWRTNMELAELNNRLQQTQTHLVQKEKLASIGQLAAGIAHEINNPLGFLRSNQTAFENFFDAIQHAWKKACALDDDKHKKISDDYELDYIFSEMKNAFSESEDGFKRIMTIVSNLKSFARLGACADFASYDLNKGIESTLVIAWNEIKYVAEVEKKLGTVREFNADGGALNQVVLNLLVNAAQAIDSKKLNEKGRIVVETFEKKSFAVLKISDNGLGIPEDIRLKIFDPFFTTKEPGKGTGLGLFISYDIVVNKHKGRISVESELGKGTVFTVELPIEQAG